MHHAHKRMRLGLLFGLLLLLAAAATGAVQADDSRQLDVHVIPSDYAGGRFSTLVQVVFSPSAPRGTWEVTTRVHTRDQDRQYADRVTIPASGIPAVLEFEVAFPPGAYEIIAQAKRTSTAGETLSRSIKGSWPDPEAVSGPAVVGPIAVLQEAVGVFSRGGSTRKSGSLAQARYQPLRSDLRSALRGIVCRAPGGASRLTVGRKLDGQRDLNFEDVEMDLGENRCGVVQDLVPVGALRPGLFLYEVRVRGGGEDLARRVRVFSVVEPGP